MKVLFIIQILAIPLGTKRKDIMKRLPVTLSLNLLFFNIALAHSEFQSSVPANGALLDHAPTEIVLNFEGDIQPDFSIFKVYALPENILADTAHKEGESHSDDHSETSHEDTSSEHGEDESHDKEHSEDSHSHDDTGATTEHSHTESHSDMDTAAKMFIPTVIDLQGDEEARADTGINSTDALAKSVTINLKENLPPGVYVVMFRVLSADTHIVEGFITFEISGH
jgi:methionine-rich copper-binding protein CopC